VRIAPKTDLKTERFAVFESSRFVTTEQQSSRRTRGGSKGGDWAIAPPKTHESIFIHHNILQFGKQHPRYKPIPSSIVLSQRQCCEVYFISLTVVN